MSTKITCRKLSLFLNDKIYFILYNDMFKNIDRFENRSFCNAVLVKLSYKPRTLNFTQEGQIALRPGSRCLHVL